MKEAIFGALATAFIGLVWNGWQAPSKADLAEHIKETKEQTARIEERTFDMAYKLGQQDERSRKSEK